MKTNFGSPIALGFALVLACAATASAECNVCHSKNPKMVHMHSALGYKDCFTCHGPMQSSGPEDKETRWQKDERCIPCHAKKPK